MSIAPSREPYYSDSTITLHHGDCLDVLASLPDASVDAVVCDPPYGLEFMGKDWDAPWKHGFGETGYTDGKRMARPNFGSSRNPVCRSCRKHQRGTKRCTCPTPDFDERPADSNVAFGAWCEAWSRECLRVLKPGGHMLAFGGTRTFHRLACAVEDAGFEVRDSIAWLYGSGFPKSLDVSKAIDKAAGADRVDLGPGQWAHVKAGGTWTGHVYGDEPGHGQGPRSTAPATLDAERWQGWGTALKPAFEPIVVARKPLSGTVAANVLAHGTGALNIDGCRLPTNGEVLHTSTVPNDMRGGHYGSGHRPGEPSANRRYTERGGTNFAATPGPRGGDDRGRWPANVVLDESQAAELDEQSGELTSGGRSWAAGDEDTPSWRNLEGRQGPATRGVYQRGTDSGGASRFFYVAKADSSERVRVNGVAHPTVKPLALMRWLVRLVTPPGGTVLEPFAGSGTTVEACILEGFRCVAIEREADYLPLIVQRINRRRDPVEAVKGAGEDGGLFDLLGEVGA